MSRRLSNVFAVLACATSTSATLLAGCGTDFKSCDGGSGCPSDDSAGAAGTAGEPNIAGASGADGSSGAGGEASGSGGESGAGGVNSSNGGSGASDAGATGDAGSAGEGGAAGGASCDSNQAPNEDRCVIDEDHGVFVSPLGDDESGDGSRDKPYATLAVAIEQASTSDRRVYACADGGAYREAPWLEAPASGLELFGGFSCSDWSYDTERKSEVSSPYSRALRITGVSSLRIEDFRFEATAGIESGESSIGVFIANSTRVVLRRTEIEALDGRDGANGTLTPQVYAPQASLDGNGESPEVPGTGGEEKVCACQMDSVSRGGKGGAPTSPSGQTGGTGEPALGGGLPGFSGHRSCTNGSSGTNGVSSPDAASGEGASTLGSAATGNWKPTTGKNGGTALPGQGGGGGASLNALGHGGGGGCGGCGGSGATAGEGGGGSIAVFVFNSSVQIEASNFTTGNGGDGGKGLRGQAGQQSVGLGGSTLDALNSCPGGNGGPGGDGGSSGGGAGGISVGILWSGEEPVQVDVTTALGDPGLRGVGGEPGENDGVLGVAQDVLEAP